MNILANIGIAAVVAAGGFAGGAQWHAGRDAVAARKADAAAQVDASNKRKVIDSAATGHETDKEEIRVVYRTVTKEVQRVSKTPFYAADQLCLDDAGLRALASAPSPARASASQPAPAVPAGARPGKRPAPDAVELGR